MDYTCTYNPDVELSRVIPGHILCKGDIRMRSLIIHKMIQPIWMVLQ